MLCGPTLSKELYRTRPAESPSAPGPPIDHESGSGGAFRKRLHFPKSQRSARLQGVSPSSRADARINDLTEALYLIRNVGVDERFDDLRDVAGNLNVRIDPEDSVADIAARIYLAEPQALIRLDRADLYRRRRKFESFVARDACQLSPDR